MGEKTTITVQESTLERFKELKAELEEHQSSCPDHTADSFLSALLDTWEAADEGYYDNPAEEITNALRAEIDGLAFDGAVFDEEAERIIQRIEELESRIPKQTADELERRLR